MITGICRGFKKSRGFSLFAGDLSTADLPVYESCCGFKASWVQNCIKCSEKKLKFRWIDA